MPHEFWFSVRVSDDMEKLNVYSFYTFGALVKVYHQRVISKTDIHDRILALAHIKGWFEIFLDRSSDTTWRAARDRARQMVSLLDEKIGDEVFSSNNFELKIEPTFIDRLTKLLQTFEATFASENESSNVFSVSRKGTHDCIALMDAADENLPPDVRGRLSAQTIRDIKDAGKCLALDCHTASGYHILRAVERVIIKYVDKVTSSVTLKKKPRDWGAYITVLENHGGDKKVIGNLQHIKDHYRNPIIHPEATLSPDDAFSLFNTSISAIIQLDAAIEALP
jgi:hypothetical protein